MISSIGSLPRPNHHFPDVCVVSYAGGMNPKSLLAAIAIAILVQSVPAFAEAPQNAWPQTYVDVPADPAVLYGQLPNGMRYAIMHHETPKGAISIRLRIGSGSIVETADAYGVA